MQILKPLLSFPRPRRIIITVLDEEVDTQPERFGLSANGTTAVGEQNAETEVGAWSPHSTRIPNLHAGLIYMSDDFDDPLPDSFWLGEEDSTRSDGSGA